MKVLVAIKRVVDYNVKVRVKADNSGVDLANVKMSMDPFCEIAVEEAVRLKELSIKEGLVATEIVVVSVGPSTAQEQLRTDYLLGADEYSLDEVINRLLAYQQAGADSLYAPGLKTLEDVQAVQARLSNPLTCCRSRA